MMRFAQYKLFAIGLVSVGLIALAGFGTFTALAQRPELPGTEPTKAPPPADQKDLPAVVPAGDSITAFPEPDATSFADLMAKCPKTLNGKKVPIAPNDSPLVQLQKAKLNAAISYLSSLMERNKAGALDEPRLIVEACDRVVVAAADTFTPTDLRPWFEERVRVAKWHEKMMESNVKIGARLTKDLDMARYVRLDAEIALFKLILRLKAPQY